MTTTVAARHALLVDRTRFGATLTAATLSQWLRDRVDLDIVSDDRAGTIRPTIAPPRSSLLLRERER